uniref:Large ribosomal subunit protein uL29 n=1 Tax=candidate division WWE3 bacterium TaxID=2053526 RepID=A0A7C4TPX9_UNCKA
MSINAKDLRSKTIEELKESLKIAKAEIYKSSSATMQGAEKDRGKSQKLRRDVARIMTVLNEKKILSEVKL